MPRFRRYRVFLIFAFIAIALLYHVSKNTQWERFQVGDHRDAQSHHSSVMPNKPETGPDHQTDNSRPAPKPNPQPPKKHQSIRPRPPVATSPAPNAGPSIKIPKLKTADEVKGAYGLPTAAPTKTPRPKPASGAYETPSPGVPGSSGHHDTPKESESEEATRYADWPPKTVDDSEPATAVTVPHWKKPYEFFPVAEQEMIMLPTGKPKPIPKVQFEFSEESSAAKEKRENRLAKIKAEAKRAWTGYKQYAWGHDEVRPVSKVPHDPFCGWAATLVDAMDTLWIMGLKDEFDDAVEAVKKIDFSTTPYRSDIPVFETIIRYLGGLLGAYDVTDGPKGPYGVLLDKAEELAEILMSVFDTPNRMPILYYHWKPQDNEKPKRASSNSGVAEMGSMSMEFTRLAQLTGKNKYYDAIARITDALEDLQNRPGGTAISGIFPQNIDASGCNRTAATERKKLEADRKQAEEEARRKAEQKEAADEEARKKAATEQATEDTVAPAHRHDDDDKLETDSNGDGKDDLAFEVQAGSKSGSTVPHEVHGITKRSETGMFWASGDKEDPDCVPQGLKSPGYGSDSYSMGGSQDSAYEYFPKQYALLGGLEPKYRSMHEKTVEGVKNFLLFRPQAQGDPDVLFAAKAVSFDGTDKALSYEYEVTHLTCFLGGMFGLGGKIFESPEDVEIGKRLAAGCAWAYAVMPTGIMPEYSQILPCDSTTECSFNATQWGLKVDPYMNDREKQMEEYRTLKAKWDQEVVEIEKKNARAEAEERLKAKEAKLAKEEEARRKAEEEKDRSRRPVNDTLTEDGRAASKQRESSAGHAGHDLKEKDTMPAPLHKRGPIQEGDPLNKYAPAAKAAEGKVKKVEEKTRKVEGALDFNANPAQPPKRNDNAWQRPDYGSTTQQKIFTPPEPTKPQTHKEFIASQNLFPGFTAINDRRYILR